MNRGMSHVFESDACDIMCSMKIATISKGGQISIPAAIRHRWGVHRVVVTEVGDSLVIRPLPDDPIKTLRGSLRGTDLTSDDVRRELRSEEEAAEERKFGQLGR